MYTLDINLFVFYDFLLLLPSGFDTLDPVEGSVEGSGGVRLPDGLKPFSKRFDDCFSDCFTGW